MKLAEAIERLERIHAHDRRDSILVVPFNPGFVTVGGRPHKPVKSINPGFDWDSGKVFLELEGGVLMAPSEDIEKLRGHVRRYTEALGRIALALTNSGLPPDAKLKAIESWVEDATGHPVRVRAPERVTGGQS
ncbi:hypothetical protein [Cupriavidus pauculus]|uniref:hypothetical protein n=1 Tax=Cupriavidus pauculus TaxID=82633 RepID=UPI001D0C088A|nr:hypothetical protein [Cupriavidus pauculus]